MSLVLQSSGGGSITIQEPVTASNFTQTVPAATGNIVLDTATQTLTNKTITSPVISGSLNAPSGVLATQNGMTGIAKAWVTWDGSTSPNNTIKSSFNVSSITYVGSSVWTVNFTTAMPSANYTMATAVGYTTTITRGGNFLQYYWDGGSGTAPTASSVTVICTVGSAGGSLGALNSSVLQSVSIFSS
jgi:hypothetical protein